MAEAGRRKRLVNLNIVHNDEIWKDHIRHEFVSVRYKWPETWGYLLHEYRKLNCDLEGRQVSPSPMSSKHAVGSGDGGKLPVIPDRRIGFPRTSSQEIGWKSTQDSCITEMVARYGQKIRGKCTIERRLCWPRDYI